MPYYIKNVLFNNKQKKIYEIWLREGKPAPDPHLHKVNVIKDYQRKLNYNIFVETGTYRGDMIDAQKQNFNDIYSIELSEKYFENAKKRFKSSKNIHLFLGDSGLIISNVLRKINESAIFWLDGHYSGGDTAKGELECPIYKELEAIFQTKHNHLLIIDDARCFIGTNSYPSVKELEIYVKMNKPKSKFTVEYDSIRIELIH
jgi:hypothetical protein